MIKHHLSITKITKIIYLIRNNKRKLYLKQQKHTCPMLKVLLYVPWMSYTETLPSSARQRRCSLADQPIWIIDLSSHYNITNTTESVLNWLTFISGLSHRCIQKLLCFITSNSHQPKDVSYLA